MESRSLARKGLAKGGKLSSHTVRSDGIMALDSAICTSLLAQVEAHEAGRRHRKKPHSLLLSFRSRWSSLRDLSGANALTLSIATDAENGPVTVEIGVDVSTGDCSNWTDKKFHILGSVTVAGRDGWVKVTLPFSGYVLDGGDAAKIMAIVFKSNEGSTSRGKAVYFDDVEFVSCGQCQVMNAVDYFDNQADFDSGNNVARYGYSTDGTGAISWESNYQVALWQPNAASAISGSYMYTLLRPADTFCRDFSSANFLQMQLFSDATEPITFDVGLDINNGDCGSYNKEFRLLGTVTVYPDGWRYTTFPLSQLGADRSKVLALVFIAPPGSKARSSKVFIDDVQFVSCPF